MAACVERRAACGASYNACASGATPCKFETRQPARPAGKATADRQFQRRVGRRLQSADSLFVHSEETYNENHSSPIAIAIDKRDTKRFDLAAKTLDLTRYLL